MSHARSAPDLPAGVAAPHVEVRRKKRPQRAFHGLPYALPQAPFSTASGPLVLPLGGISPSGSQASFFTPLPPATPKFPTGFASPTPQFSPADLNGTQASVVSGLAAMNVSQPLDGHDLQPPALTVSSSRYIQQEEFCTPLAVNNGVPSAENGPFSYKKFLLFENIVPPVAGTQFHAVDQGTATPRHMRTTFYNVPELEALRRATRMPVAVTVRPFAPVLPTEEPVPTVDHSRLGEMPGGDPLDVGPPRCRRCRTYMNPAMVHTSLGRFTCNVCQFPNNSVPHEYMSPLDPMTGQRADQRVRPELHRGVYDIVVPSYYNLGGETVQAPPLHHVFLVDVSHQSVIRQLPVLLADAMRAVLFTEHENPVRCAIILFDTRMHFFNLAPHLDAAQICISGDLNDPFVPFSTGLFADPERSRPVIEDALNRLEMLAHERAARDPEPCFAVALRTAQLCLAQVGGGKITAVLSALSSWGPGRSKIKENRGVGRAQLTEAERALYAPDNDYYKLLAKDFITLNVGLDVFVVSDTPADLANIGWLALSTGGHVCKWLHFVFERDGAAFTAQIVAATKKCRGYQGQLKLRCSNGLQVSQYYGFSSGDNSALLDPVVPVLTEDQTFTILLEYDGTLDTKYDCHFQAALLYTDPHGVRKVRIINLVLAVSERLADVFNFVDQDTVVTTVLRDTISFIGKESIDDLRRSLNQKLVDIFTAYRALAEEGFNRNSPLANQLIFPDSLKHLPSYFLALIKSKALRDSSTLSLDSRLADIFQMLYMPIERLVYHLYPALVELHSLADDEGMPYVGQENTDGFIKLPEFKCLTSTALENSVYILCDGNTVYVRVHPESNTLLLKDLFGDHVESYRDIDPLLDSLPDLPTHISQQARNIVQYFNQHIVGSDPIGSLAVVIVRDGIDGLVHEFRDCLIEDKLASKALNTSPNYMEFLSALHKAVKVKLESETKSRERKRDVGHPSDTLAQRMIQF